MMKPLLVAGLAAVAFIPSMASAQTDCQEQRHDNRVVGTVVGGIAGALLGNAIGHGGGREGGTIIGGVGGAVAGNAIAAGATHCGPNGANQYGYWDANGQWVPNTSTAYGYYDSNGQWIATQSQTYAPPPPPPGYANQGYAPPPPPPGSDSQGYAPPAPGYGHDAAYQGGGDRRMMDTQAREERLEHRIRDQIANGALDDEAGRHAMHELRDIREADQNYRSVNGQLTGEQFAYIDSRLDALRDRLRMQHEDGDAGPR